MHLFHGFWAVSTLVKIVRYRNWGCDSCCEMGIDCTTKKVHLEEFPRQIGTRVSRTRVPYKVPESTKLRYQSGFFQKKDNKLGKIYLPGRLVPEHQELKYKSGFFQKTDNRFWFNFFPRQIGT